MLKREETEWRRCKGGMLLDDAGLGKTLVLLSLICDTISKRETRPKGIRMTTYLDY